MRSCLTKLTFAALLLGGACSQGTKVTETWKSPSAEAVGMRRVLVVALVPTESIRRSLEDDLAKELHAEGISAVPSNQLIEDASTVTRESVKEVVERQAFDSVLVAEYLGTTRRADYVPGTYDGYIGYVAPLTYDPGYYVEEADVRLEFRLFNARGGGRMIWSAMTSTIDPDSADEAVPEMAKKVVARMEDDVR